MLSSVLRGERAALVNVEIMRAFAHDNAPRGGSHLATLAAEREQGEGEAQDAGGRATP